MLEVLVPPLEKGLIKKPTIKLITLTAATGLSSTVRFASWIIGGTAANWDHLYFFCSDLAVSFSTAATGLKNTVQFFVM